MKAKLPKNDIRNAKNLAHDKETVRQDAVITLYKGELREAATVHWYMGRSRSASRVYCSVWIYTTNGQLCTGHGHADGYGYHKESAAFAAALDSAGVGLLTDDGKRAHIGGAGDTAIRKALEAITRAAGYRGKMIIV